MPLSPQLDKLYALMILFRTFRCMSKNTFLRQENRFKTKTKSRPTLRSFMTNGVQPQIPLGSL